MVEFVGLSSEASGALSALEAFGSNGTPATKFSSAIALTPIPGAQLIAAIPSLLSFAGFGKAATIENPLPVDRWEWYQPGGMLWGIPVHTDDKIWAMQRSRIVHQPGLFWPTIDGVDTNDVEAANGMVWRAMPGQPTVDQVCLGGTGLSGTTNIHASCLWKEWHLRGSWREATIGPDGVGRWVLVPGPSTDVFRVGRYVPTGEVNLEVSEAWLKKTVARVKSMRKKAEGKPPTFVDIDKRSWLQFARGAFAHHVAGGGPKNLGPFDLELNAKGIQRENTGPFGSKTPPGIARALFVEKLTTQFEVWLESEWAEQARDFYEVRMANHAAREALELQAWEVWKAELASLEVAETAQEELAAKVPSPTLGHTFVPPTLKPKPKKVSPIAVAASGAAALAALLL